MDFNLTLPSFEPHIQGVQQLIAFSAAALHEIHLLFTSSIGAVDGYKEDLVPEMIMDDFSVARMGYGQSKLVAERLLADAATKGQIVSTICRLGQIAGPVRSGSEKGVWTKKEWLPTVGIPTPTIYFISILTFEYNRLLKALRSSGFYLLHLVVSIKLPGFPLISYLR